MVRHARTRESKLPSVITVGAKGGGEETSDGGLVERIFIGCFKISKIQFQAPVIPRRTCGGNDAVGRFVGKVVVEIWVKTERLGLRRRSRSLMDALTDEGVGEAATEGHREKGCRDRA